MTNKSTKPLVSIIIPTYKRSKTLRRTIESVLNQSYTNIELIVVDDNGLGTDNQIETEESIGDYISTNKVVYLKHLENKNGSAARNTGFRACNGDYVNFLDDDDIMLPRKIELQLDALLNAKSNVGATYCNTIKIEKQLLTGITKKSESHYIEDGNILVPYLLGKIVFNTSSILFKKSVLEDLNGFDESWRRHQDYELMVRFFQRYTIVCASLEPLMIYDVTGDRLNIPSPSKQYDLEERFLGTFQPLIPPDDFPNVWKKMWMSCCSISILSCNYSIFRKSLKKLKELNNLGFKDNLKILKWILMSLILRNNK